jgi:hypothetical protein
VNRIISFSVWGNQDFYFKGCLENIEIAKEIYPEWKTRFYCDSLVSKDFQYKLKEKGAEVVEKITINSSWEGLFWRFLPASDDDVDIFISRDIDSRLNWREKAAVDEWIISNKKIHCMRDHIEHNVPMLGGMWGCKKGALSMMKDMIISWPSKEKKGSDQDFLHQIVWNNNRGKIIAHDRFNKGIKIEQVVKNVEEYMNQINASIEYKKITIEARNKYIEEQALLEREVFEEELNRIFPIPVVPEIKKNDMGQILYDYIYDPLILFGEHDIRPFPDHRDIKYGSYVGEIIK